MSPAQPAGDVRISAYMGVFMSGACPSEWGPLVRPAKRGPSLVQRHALGHMPRRALDRVDSRLVLVTGVSRS